MSAPPDFDALYERDHDPWEVATSWYERRKIALVLAVLRRERYGVAWDAGCGTGELAAALAGRCDRVVATDATQGACDLTAVRAAGLPGVHVERSALPEPPRALDGRADLVVVSEVLYYLDEASLDAATVTLARACHDETDVVAVHWRARPEGARLSGAAAQRALNARLMGDGFERVVTHTDPEFVLAVWSRDVPTTSGS